MVSFYDRDKNKKHKLADLKAKVAAAQQGLQARRAQKEKDDRIQQYLIMGGNAPGQGVGGLPEAAPRAEHEELFPNHITGAGSQPGQELFPNHITGAGSQPGQELLLRHGKEAGQFKPAAHVANEAIGQAQGAADVHNSLFGHNPAAMRMRERALAKDFQHQGLAKGGAEYDLGKQRASVKVNSSNPKVAAARLRRKMKQKLGRKAAMAHRREQGTYGGDRYTNVSTNPRGMAQQALGYAPQVAQRFNQQAREGANPGLAREREHNRAAMQQSMMQEAMQGQRQQQALQAGMFGDVLDFHQGQQSQASKDKYNQIVLELRKRGIDDVNADRIARQEIAKQQADTAKQNADTGATAEDRHGEQFEHDKEQDAAGLNLRERELDQRIAAARAMLQERLGSTQQQALLALIEQNRKLMEQTKPSDRGPLQAEINTWLEALGIPGAG